MIIDEFKEGENFWVPQWQCEWKCLKIRPRTILAIQKNHYARPVSFSKSEMEKCIPKKPEGRWEKSRNGSYFWDNQINRPMQGQGYELDYYSNSCYPNHWVLFKNENFYHTNPNIPKSDPEAAKEWAKQIILEETR